jgi:hypothetical protein
MKTSSFFTYQGLGRISIARFAPRRTPAGYRVFQPLAPGRWFKEVSAARYRELYFEEILGALDPKETLAKLHELSAGAEPVLLCWEQPPLTADNWCHRRMAAEWFEKALGIEVPELEPAATPSTQTSLFQGGRS